MLKTMKNIILVTGALTILYGCSPSIVFDKTIRFESLIWNRFNVIEMDVPVQMLEKGYNFSIIFQHNNDFAFDFISMNITFYMPGGAMRSRDYQFRLQDGQGNWLGEPDNGFFSLEWPLLNGLKFSEEGVCRVRIENKMVKFNTIGVESIGLVVKPAK